METIGSVRAIRMIRKTGRLENVHVLGELYMLELGSEVRFPIEFKDCEFDFLNSMSVQYCEPVVWDHCLFKRVSLSAAYLYKGLTCKDCEFTDYFCWDMGAHNIPEGPVLFKRVKFRKFADFWDSVFDGPFVLRDVEFLDGTNFMNERFSWVSFKYPPVLDGVKGELDQMRNIPGGGGHMRGLYEQDSDGWWAPTGKKYEPPRKRSLLDRILGR